MPDTRQLLLLIGLGLFGGLAQVLMVLALKATHASLLAPFEYVGMVWAVLIGFFAFGALPDVYTLAGAAIVAAAGLLTIWREHHLTRTARKHSQSVPDLLQNPR
jgi:drug/metabolite transporter (DMT)-like permease